MKCQSCNKQDATIHYFESINGASKNLNLCESCAALKGIESLSIPFVTMDALLKMVPEGFLESKAAGSANRKSCVSCGMTYADVRRNPDKACPACLDTFLTLPELRNRLKKEKASGLPAGEEKAAEMESSSPRVHGLKRLLAKAIELEEYEEAARLRDLIRKEEENPEAAFKE